VLGALAAFLKGRRSRLGFGCSSGWVLAQFERTAPTQDEGRPSIRVAKIPQTSRPKPESSAAAMR